MKKKKKKETVQNWLGYCPILSIGTGSRYSHYIVTQRLADWPGLGEVQCNDTNSVSWLWRHEKLEEVCHDTSNCIVTGAWVGLLVERVTIHSVVS